jgi:hypothetical protein
VEEVLVTAQEIAAVVNGAAKPEVVRSMEMAEAL